MNATFPIVLPGKRFHRTVSPSQIETFKKCPRRWYNASVLYDREPQKAFQVKGDAIHKALEEFGKTGEVLPTVTLPAPDGTMVETSTFAFVQAAIPHLAPPVTDPYWDEWKGKGPNGTNSAGLMLEQQADMSTWAQYPEKGAPILGPNWTQFIDRIEAYPDHAKIWDFKTTSDFRYAKKPQELKELNTQLLANARWLFMNSDYKTIQIGHLYLGTKTKTPKALPVTVEVTREDVEKVWTKDIEIVKEMVTWAAMGSPTADPLPPNTSSCGDYGGCFYREKCGFDSKGQALTKIRPFGKAPEVSAPLFPITIAPRTSAPINAVTDTVRSSMETTPAATKPATGLLATLMEKRNATPGAAPPPAPSASPAPVVGLVVPAGAKANPFGPKVVAAPGVTVGSVTPASGPATAPAATPVVVKDMPATPPPAKGGGLAALLGKKAAPPATEAAPGSITPPDAAPDTSTAAEVAAANPEPETPPVTETSTEVAALATAPAEAPKPRKGRPPGSKNKPPGAEVSAADLAIAATGAVAGGAPMPGTPEFVAALTKIALASMAAPAPPETAPAAAPPETAPAAAPVDGAMQAIRDRFKTADPNFECGARFLFVDCMPGKGWPTENMPADLNDFMHAFQSAAASSANALDYRLIKYEQKAYLCMAIRVLMKGLPPAVHVNTNTPGAAEFLAEVTPYAEMIFRGTR